MTKGRLYRCPDCGETLSSPPENYICPLREAARNGDTPPADPSKETTMSEPTPSAPPPFPSTYVTRQTLMEGGQAIDVTAGIHVERIAGSVIAAPEGGPAFPPLLPETASQTFSLMYQGAAFAITVGLQLQFPPPVSSAEI